MSDTPHSESTRVAIVPTKRSFLWGLVPARLRVAIFYWRFRRQARRRHVDVQREFRAQFPLLTPRNRGEVANLLRREWDHTGTRLLGVPSASFGSFANVLLMVLSRGVSDAQLAERIAELEADLGLVTRPSSIVLPSRVASGPG